MPTGLALTLTSGKLTLIMAQREALGGPASAWILQKETTRTIQLLRQVGTIFPVIGEFGLIVRKPTMVQVHLSMVMPLIGQLWGMVLTTTWPGVTLR